MRINQFELAQKLCRIERYVVVTISSRRLVHYSAEQELYFEMQACVHASVSACDMVEKFLEHINALRAVRLRGGRTYQRTFTLAERTVRARTNAYGILSR